MKCPVCEIEFRGNQFYRSGGRGRFRDCPNGHTFKEAPKVNITAQREKLGYKRYEYLRTLNPRQFAELYAASMEGNARFDDLVDQRMINTGTN